MRATRGTIGDRGGATPRSRESEGGGTTYSRTHAHTYARMSTPRTRERVPWIMSALWYRCINLT